MDSRFCRDFNIRLFPDTSVLHKDLVIETAMHGVIQVDTSHIYTGTLIGESGSQVYGALRRGVFEGSIHTTGDDFYVERASNFFNGSAPFHSVLYSARDVEFPPPEGTGGSQRRRQWCGLYGHRERWMNRVLDSFGKRKVGVSSSSRVL
ncbi:conserved hypothetical protein [Ixodes scapularis]|uniref:Uncharacterized protein n=1 Tax=Ixodes scapularis TaxID=6945 RepID=B7P7P3_IXOSC|nr:conserved hypothetical protein [Ixodes scapularis]|eukprot:XP_002399412.1 conserved hypothetical protein [Ixodes scapularis]